MWGIVGGSSYPYLLSFYPTAPRVISGTAASVGGNIDVAIAGNGTAITTVKTAANSSFYYLAANAAIADSTNILAYISGNATKANIIALAPTSGGSLTGLTMSASTVTAGTSATSALSTSALSTAKGALSTDILYSVSGNDLTLSSGYNFAREYVVPLPVAKL